MTHPIAARVAALLIQARQRLNPPAVEAPCAGATLASLNRARPTAPHPALPAYRLRRGAGRRSWPFQADTGAGTSRDRSDPRP